MNLDELIMVIFSRPGGFLGNDRNLKSLHCYLCGFIFAKSIYNKEKLSEYESSFNRCFEEFVVSRLFNINNPYSSDLLIKLRYKGWDRIINLISKSDDEAWSLFFELYKEFRTTT